MAIRTILPQGLKDEEDDAPKKFTNIDSEDFDFSWNNKWYRVKAGYTVIMPKYRVNYAAYHLARKMFKRDSLAEWEEKRKQGVELRGFPMIHDDKAEVALQALMVKDNPNINPEVIKAIEEKRNIEILEGVAPEALDNIREPGQKTLNAEGNNLPTEQVGKKVEELEDVGEPKQESPPVEPEKTEPAQRPDEPQKKEDTPPAEPEGSGKLEPSKEGFPCDKCNFVAKSEFGLKSHMRKHQKGATN